MEMPAVAGMTENMNIALIIYLVFLIAIAVRSARRVKDIPDFFVARKGASAKAVAGSLVATILGGSAVIGAVDSGAKLGGAASWFMLVGALGLLALIPFAGRAYSHGKYALPDLVENLYGKGPRLVASFVIPVAWTGIVAAQIIAAAKLLMTFTSMGYMTAAIVSAAVFTGYTLAGGQVSILRTDFLQACLIIAGLLLLAGFAKFGGGEFGSVVASATTSVAPKFPFNTNFTPLDLFLLILTYCQEGDWHGGMRLDSRCIRDRIPGCLRREPRRGTGCSHYGDCKCGIAAGTFADICTCAFECGAEQCRYNSFEQFHHH